MNATRSTGFRYSGRTTLSRNGGISGLFAVKNADDQVGIASPFVPLAVRKVGNRRQVILHGLSLAVGTVAHRAQFLVELARLAIADFLPCCNRVLRIAAAGCSDAATGLGLMFDDLLTCSWQCPGHQKATIFPTSTEPSLPFIAGIDFPLPSRIERTSSASALAACHFGSVKSGTFGSAARTTSPRPS